jgi:putative methyltransferase (TIGR04325 family)
MVSLYRTLHWLVDVPVALVTGKYRVGHLATRPNAAEQNTNEHYIRPTDEIIEIQNSKILQPMPDALYPVFYWIQRAITEVDQGGLTRICDWGGGYAILLPKLNKYITHPLELTVIEIDAIVKHAKSISGLEKVKFENTSVQLPSIDILHTNGTTQVAADEFMEFLDRHKPKWVIVSGMEGVQDEPTFYSTQVLRSSNRRATYKTHNVNEFATNIERYGYNKIDMWLGEESKSGAFLQRIKPVYGYGFAFRRLHQ